MAGAGAKPHKEEESDTNTCKKIKLTDLPTETITSILEQAGGNMDSVLVLANSNKAMFAAVEQWQCGGEKCSDRIYAVEDEKLVVPRENAEPFSCVSCGKNFCGQRSCL